MTSIRTYGDAVLDTSTVSQSQVIKDACVLSKVTAISAATTLSIAQSGHKFVITPVEAASYAITLPAVATAAGVSYEFVLGTGGVNQTVTLVARSAVLNGIFRTGAAGLPLNALVSAATTITFTASNLAGTYVSVWSDGTKWYVDGQSGILSGLSAV
jgi:hypothetical protein